MGNIWWAVPQTYLKGALSEAKVDADKSANFMGMRCSRFAMIVQNNNIEELLIETPGEYKETSAENLLTKI